MSTLSTIYLPIPNYLPVNCSLVECKKCILKSVYSTEFLRLCESIITAVCIRLLHTTTMKIFEINYSKLATKKISFRFSCTAIVIIIDFYEQKRCIFNMIYIMCRPSLLIEINSIRSAFGEIREYFCYCCCSCCLLLPN